MDTTKMPTYSYNDDYPPEKNIGIALYAIANELRNISFGNATDIRHGALEGLAMHITDGFSELSSSISELNDSLITSVNKENKNTGS